MPTDLWGVGSYRVLFPARELEQHGHETFAHIDSDRYDKWRAPDGNVPIANAISFKEDGTPAEAYDADVYVFQRRFEWWVPSAIRLLRNAGKVVIGETDDLYDNLSKWSPAAKVLRDHPKLVSVGKMNEGFAFCNHLTVSTPALAEHYSRYNRNVTVLPNFLDWEMWEEAEQQSEIERGRLRIGWMGWLNWRGRDLDSLRSFMGGWLRRHPDVDFVSIGEPERPPKGHVSVHDYLGVPVRQRLTVPMAPFRELARILPNIDVGLVPLELNQFNECKSYLKGLEYAACGIPCVATPTQQYRQFVCEGEDGLLARTSKEWQDALDEIVSDDDWRREMGRAARAKAAANTIQEHWPLWEHVYTDLASGSGARSTASTSDTSACSSVQLATAPSPSH